VDVVVADVIVVKNARDRRTHDRWRAPRPAGKLARMRRLLVLMSAALVTAVVAGCGGSSTGATLANPTTQVLSYFPPATPFVMTLSTAANSQSVQSQQALMRKVPSVAIAETALFAKLSQAGIDYNRDIRPLFGKPIAVGAAGAALSGTHTPFLVAWVTKTAAKLSALAGKITALRSAGTHDGAKLLTGNGAAVAISGSTLLLSGSVSDLEAALDRHAHQQGFTAAEYAQATAGISSSGAVQMFGDLKGALASPSAAKARAVPWVAAIKSYGVSLGATANGMSMQFHIDTSGAPLTAAQLPIASGSGSPPLSGDMPVQAAVRDPAQIITFIEAAVRATSPAQYAKFLSQAASLKRRSGFDVNALLGMLTGALSVESDTHSTILRAQVSNPSQAETMIAKLVHSGALPPSSRVTSLGGGLYSLHSAGSSSTETMGVIGSYLVLGKASPAQLRAFAPAPASTASTGSGSVSFRIALADLLRLTLKDRLPAVTQQYLNLLGDFSGSASATTSGLSGTATLTLH
jgi:hypothetical protein